MNVKCNIFILALIIIVIVALNIQNGRYNAEIAKLHQEVENVNYSLYECKTLLKVSEDVGI